MTHPMDSATGQLLNNRIFLESSGEIRKGYPELSIGLFQCDGFSYWMLSILAAMVEWLRCSTRIHKVLCSNLSITIRGMTLDKSLTAKLSRMTHS